jgi:hypothetical protein
MDALLARVPDAPGQFGVADACEFGGFVLWADSLIF